MEFVYLMMDCIYILMNWTCNCSLYNTIVLVVAFGTLVAGVWQRERGSKRWSRGVRQRERGSERWSRGVRQRERGSERWSWGVRQRERGSERWSRGVNANAGWNTRKQIVMVEFQL